MMDHIILSAVAFFLVALVLIYLWQPRKASCANDVPWAKLSMREAIALVTSEDTPSLIHEQSHNSGPIFRLAIPKWKPFVVCTDYVTSKHIQMDASNDKSEEYRVVELGSGCPILLSKKTSSTGPNGWAAERKTFSPLFTKSKYDFGVLRERLGQFDDYLKLAIKQDKGEINAPEGLVWLMIDIFGSSAFGIDMQALNGTSSSLGRMFLEELKFAHQEIVLRQSAAPWRRFMLWDPDVKRSRIASDRLVCLGQHILDNARTTKLKNPQAPLCGIMQELLKFPFPSDKHRAVEVTSFLTGGFDTTGYTLAWVLYELARNPDEQAALAVDLELDDSPPRLNRVINESMRLWPVVAGGGLRELSKDVITRDNIRITKGTTVSFPAFSTFRQPWISRADEFVPERWCDDAPQIDKLRDMFSPFNRGRRNCIGQTHAQISIKAILAYLIRGYEWSTVGDPKPVYYLTLKPEGLRLRIKERPSKSQGREE